MRNLLLFLLVQSAALTSCVSKGYVPHYILTDSPESKDEIRQLDKQESLPSKEDVDSSQSP